MITTDLKSLKLHTHNGLVWYIVGDGLHSRSRMTVEEFADSKVLANADSVRVIGMAENADLIIALAAKQREGELDSVEVVTPLVCATAAERQEPLMALYRMRSFLRAPSLGGYHQLTTADLRSYELVVSLRDEGWTPATQCILMQHPVWYPLKFIPELDWKCCAELIATIIDPRWFVDVFSPDRSAKLESFLGLDPKTQAGVSVRKAKRTRRHRLCSLVRSCWKLPRLHDIVVDRFELAGPRPFRGSNEPGLRPGDFPWRVWGYMQGIGPGSRQPSRGCVIADMRASQKFLRYMRLVWLQQLYHGKELPDQCTPLFDSALFFRLHIEEAEAFDHYMWDRPE